MEKHLIKKSNPMWKLVDYYCFQANELYNQANYLIRQKFINNRQWIRYNELDKIMKNYEIYYLLGSQASQNTLMLLDKNWTSFFASIKSWSRKKGDGYLGKPSLPKYKDKNGRSILMLKNIQCRIENGDLYFSWKPFNRFSGIKTKVIGKLMQVRFVPMGACYMMEIVYETEIPEIQTHSSRIIGIDLGIDNFATISNNIGAKSIIINGKGLKSMNQYYNKKKSSLQSVSGNIWNNRIQNLTDKHRNKTDYFMHLASKEIIEYCLHYKIDTVVIGKNDGWKQNINIGKRNNQKFAHVPFEKFIQKLKYKCENNGILLLETEESYTSGTSFLDDELPTKDNYSKKRRKKRGIFVANDGTKINADLNGSYQIIKKVFPNVLDGGNRGCDLHPVRVNL